MRGNRIHFLMDGESRLKDRESIIQHIKDFFVNLYAREDWDRPSLDKLAISTISEEDARWLEREFEEIEVRIANHDLGGDKAPGLDGFPMVFFQRFWEVTKVDIMKFMKEFHFRGKLSKSAGASFISLIPKLKELRI